FAVYNSSKRKLDLMQNIIRKSIYEHYVSLKFKQTEEVKTTNIFSMKNKPQESNIPLDKIQKMIKKIEDLWVI
ncbi:hypothetical protein IJV79_03395, partial [bacterium]|nr:hypothetical protein [bacterium]